MARDYPTIGGRTSVAELVETQIVRTGRRCFFVTEDDRLQGLVTLHHVKAVPHEQWDTTPVEAVMIPATQLKAVGPDTRLLDVMTMMEQKDINQVPVVAGGRLVGMITRDHLLRVLAAKMELDVPGPSGLSRAPATA